MNISRILMFVYVFINYNKLIGDCFNFSFVKGVKFSVLDEGSG